MNIYTKVRRILTWVCVFAFMGSNAARKVEKAINTLNNHPDKAASYCSNRFPSKDTIIYRDSLVLDTLYDLTPVEVDTIYKNDTTIVTITSPAKTIVKTITKIKEITKEPTQKIENRPAIAQTENVLGNRAVREIFVSIPTTSNIHMFDQIST